MRYVTIEQKAAAGKEFIEWLLKKYPIVGVTIYLEYFPCTTILNGAYARISRANDKVWKMEFAAKRDLAGLLCSVAHEYIHLKQFCIDKVPLKLISNSKYEAEAFHGSRKLLKEYAQEVQIEELSLLSDIS